MAENTKIEWCDHTINFWWGCEKVSPGCANCYAEGFAKRVGDDIWGKNKPRRYIKESVSKALKLNERAKKEGVRYKVFAQSMADFFEEDTGQAVVDKQARLLSYCPCDSLTIANGYQKPICHSCNSAGSTRPATLTDLRRQAFETIDATPWLDWILVTKRPENIRKMWLNKHDNLECSECSWKGVESDSRQIDFDDEPGGWACPSCKAPCAHQPIDEDKFRKNVWILTSVENQGQANKRIPELLKCRDLSPVLGLSMEPLLGPVDLQNIDDEEVWLDCLSGVYSEWSKNSNDKAPSGTTGNRIIDWVITGGESGHHARPMHPQWVRNIRSQCKSADVPFFFKQWGEWWPISQGCLTDEDLKKPSIRIDLQGRDVTASPGLWDESDEELIKVGKKSAGRLLDGEEWNQFPEVAR